MNYRCHGTFSSSGSSEGDAGVQEKRRTEDFVNGTERNEHSAQSTALTLKYLPFCLVALSQRASCTEIRGTQEGRGINAGISCVRRVCTFPGLI